MARPRRALRASLLATLLVASILPFAPGAAAAAAPAPTPASEDDPARDATPGDPVGASIDRSPLVLLRSVTGVRPRSTTVLSGAVFNGGEDPVGATVRLEGLPEAVDVVAVQPSTVQPELGLGWRCGAGSCALLDTDGDAADLPAGASVGLTIVLRGASLPATGATLRVRAGDGPTATVDLDRPDGQAPLPEEAITVVPAGPTLLEPGASSSTSVTVGNVSSVPTEPGSIRVARSGGPASVSSTAAGAGWTCTDATSCSYGPPVAPFDRTTPLEVTSTAAPGADDANGRVELTATATVGGTPVRATATSEQSVRAQRSTALSVRLELPEPSVSAPATVPAVISATPVGRGPLRATGRVGLDVPDGIDADWGAARPDDGWECSEALDGCRTTGPLPGGSATEITVPVDVASGTRPGLTRLEAVAAVDGAGDEPRSEDRAGAGLVVDPPPVAELRAMLVADGDSTVAPIPLGRALQFPSDVERPVVVRVANQGSRAARAGSTVDVAVAPDVVQQVVRVGGTGWECDGVRRLDARHPLRCTLELEQDLAAGGAVELPVVLGRSPEGSSLWSVRTGADGDLGAERRFRIDVGVVAPQLVPRATVVDELVRGGAGRVRVVLENQGDATARGSVLLVDLPAGVRPVSVDGEGWSCADATLRSANGSLSCTNPAAVQVGDRSAPLQLELSADTDRRRVEAWFWATSPGQPHRSGTRSATTLTLDVLRVQKVSAGEDLTVVTPVRGPDGVERPAVVVLDGLVPPRLADRVRWQQLCTSDGERGCGGVAPAVTWLGTGSGADPDTPVARFTAPAVPRGGATLRFRLSAGSGRNERSDEVSVRLVPAAITQVEGTATGRSAAQGSRSGADLPGPTTGGDVAPAEPTGPDHVQVQVGDGSTLQVATRTSAVLRATATGSAPFEYRWEQTSGPVATIQGSSTTAQLSFVAPSLEPDQQSARLTFEVTATDALGGTATDAATVQVVWGDDGLQVELADGAPSVVATVGTPVAVTSTVTSAGAPYQYDWSLDGGELELPSGTATDGPLLTFVAPGTPGTATAELRVTDSFGRVTTAQVDLSVTRLPSGEVPTALCAALADLTAGSSASLTGAGGAVTATIPAAGSDVQGDAVPTTTSVAPSSTTSTPPSSSTPSSTAPGSSTTTTTTTTTLPPGSCPADAVATFDGAAVALPGGVAITGASGSLSISGVTIESGTVTVPASWGAVVPAVPTQGLLLPFIDATSIDVPAGVLVAPSAPFVDPPGWSLSTQVGFRSDGTPRATLATQGGPSSGTGSLTMGGTSTGAGATSLSLSATGLVVVGGIDVPLSGTVRTAGPSDPPAFAVNGNVTEVPLAPGVDVSSLAVSWAPSSAEGTVQLAIGAGSVPLSLSGSIVVSDDDATMSFDRPSPWSPAGPTGPSLPLVGTGSVQGDELALDLSGDAPATWPAARSVRISGLSATVRASCELGGDTTCQPDVALAGSADLAPVGASSVPVTGSMDLSDGVVALTGAADTITVAPLQVTGARLDVTLDPTAGVDAVAVGVAPVLDAPRDTTVRFGATAVVAVAELGDRQLVPGWALEGTVAVAADAPTTYQVSDDGADVPVQVLPGSLTGAAVTTLPDDLTAGVLPASMTSGVVTFPIDGAAPGTYLLDVPDPRGWSIVGGDGDAVDLSIEELAFEITADGASATVQVQGTGSLELAPLGDAPDPAPVALDLRGTLTSDAGQGVLAATFSAPSWADAFGLSSLTVTGLAVTAQVTASGATAMLAGSATLPPQLVATLGAASASAALDGTLDPSTPWASLSLVAAQGSAVDPGDSGLLAAGAATLVLAPEGRPGAAAVPPGVTLQLGGIDPEDQQLSVDPERFDLSGSVSLGLAQIGGVQLDDARVEVDGTASTPYQLQGDLVLDDVGGDADDLEVAVAGPVRPAPPGTSSGVVTLTGGATSMTVDGTTFDVASLSVSPESRIGGGSAPVTMAASWSLLGTKVQATLTGSATDGDLEPLTGTVPEATYALTGDDSVAAAFTVTLGPVGEATIWSTKVVSQSDATLGVDGFTITGTVTATPTGLSVDGGLPLPGSLGLPVSVSGDYTLDDGSVSIATAPSVTLGLAGYSVSGTASFERVDGQVTGTMTATMSLGLFDDDTEVTVSGTLEPPPPTTPGTPTAPATASLTNADPVAAGLRGLDGSATLTVSPSDDPLAASGWYQAELSFAVDSPCAFWASSPTLRGQVYRSTDATYYTLTADVELRLAAGLEVVQGGQVPPQPLMLSNETSSGEQPAPGVTIQAGYSSSTFSAQGLFAFAPASCSYTVGAWIQIQYTSGPEGAAVANNTQQAPPPLQITSSLFGPDQKLPESINVLRADLQARQLAQQLAQAQAVAAAAAAQAGQQAQVSAEVRNTVLQVHAQAVSDLDTAQERLSDAMDQLSAAQTAQQQAAAQQGVEGAEAQVQQAAGRVAGAQAAVVAAEQQVGAATEQADSMSSLADAATDRANETQEASTAAAAELQAADQDVAQQTAQQNAQRSFQLSAEYTHCPTCEVVDQIQIDGEMTFALTYLAGVDLTVDWGPSGLDSITGAFSVGIIKQYVFGGSHLSAAFSAEGELTVTLGWSSQEAWFEADVELELSGSFTLYLNVWFASYSATLAELEAEATVDLIPSASLSGSVTYDLLDISGSYSFGPDDL